MKIAIIASTEDPAGMNIMGNLLNQGFKETKDKFEGHAVCALEGTSARLYTTDTDSIYCENIDKKIAEAGFKADIVIFATRHKSESGVRSLSVHVPGNWGRAGLGGKDKQICIAPASYLKAALLKLDELVKSKSTNPASIPRPPAPDSIGGFEVIQECTHHGPFVETPCIFIEIGSSEKEWNDEEAGKIIAETIIHLVKNKPNQCKTIFGIGGLHHAPEFSKIARRTDYAVGHVCPKYCIENLDAEMIKQAIGRNVEKDVTVVLDWKGLKAGKERVVELLEETGLSFRKSREFI